MLPIKEAFYLKASTNLSIFKWSLSTEELIIIRNSLNSTVRFNSSSVTLLTRSSNSFSERISYITKHKSNSQGWLKFTVRRTEGGGLKYYLFEKFRAYLFKNIKNSWDFDHFWCFLDTKVKILPIFNIILKEILKFWHIFAHFC